MLVLSRHRDEWMRSIERDCSLLHCSNPRCVHLFEHKSRGENGVDFKDRKCEETVLINVLGRMEKRYRFQPGDHIHVACQGQVCRETKQRHTTMCHLVCGECMNAEPHPAHLGMAGECRACVAETRDRKLTAISEGIRGGPREKFAEEANENSYRDAAKFAEVEEEENEAKRARNEAGGGAARRREAVARVKAKRSQAEAAERAALDELNQAQARLEAFEGGYTFLMGSEESDPNVDLQGENDDDALEFWQKVCNFEDVAKMRAQFPRCALMWLGPSPTEQQLEEQRATVEALGEAHGAAAASTALVVREIEEAPLAEAGGEAVDYDADGGSAAGADADADEDADPPAAAAAAAPVGNPNPRRGGRKAKRVGEMNEAELANHRVQRANQAIKRRENEAVKKKQLEAYPDLIERVAKFDKMQREVDRKNEVLAAQVVLMQQKDTLIAESKDRVNEEIDFLTGWLMSTSDKPDGWDGDEMIQKFQAYRARKAAKAAKRKREQAAE